jgi:hypothetical protein
MAGTSTGSAAAAPLLFSSLLLLSYCVSLFGLVGTLFIIGSIGCHSDGLSFLLFSLCSRLSLAIPFV